MGDGTGKMLQTPPSPMEGFDADMILSKLTTAEKIDLLSGMAMTCLNWRYCCSLSKALTSGIQNPYPGSEYPRFDFPMVLTEFEGRVSSMAPLQLASRAALL